VNTVLGLHELIARTWRNAPLTESERDFLKASTQYFARRRQIDQRMSQRVRRQRYVIWAALGVVIALSTAIAIHLALTGGRL
jgi:type IV secretory pathway component VirB8